MKQFNSHQTIDSLLIDGLIKDFFKQNFKIFFDNNQLEINYLGRKYQEDQIFIFAEVMGLTSPTSYEDTKHYFNTF